MGIKNKFNNYNFSTKITSLSSVEFKVDANRYCGPAANHEEAKYFRNIDTIYHANITIEDNPVTYELTVILKSIINDAIFVASEIIKTGDIEAAEMFISIRLRKELIKYGLEKTSVTKIDIHTTTHTGDWIDVPYLNTEAQND